MGQSRQQLMRGSTISRLYYLLVLAQIEDLSVAATLDAKTLVAKNTNAKPK